MMGSVSQLCSLESNNFIQTASLKWHPLIGLDTTQNFPGLNFKGFVLAYTAGGVKYHKSCTTAWAASHCSGLCAHGEYYNKIPRSPELPLTKHYPLLFSHTLYLLLHNKIGCDHVSSLFPPPHSPSVTQSSWLFVKRLRTHAETYVYSIMWLNFSDFLVLAINLGGCPRERDAVFFLSTPDQ